MKRLVYLLLVLASLSGCAHLMGSSTGTRDRGAVWAEGQEAFWAGDFERAIERFGHLSENFPETLEGRESLFYLGTIYLDPRNPEWDSEPAEQHLGEYLAFITEDGPRLYRYTEARTLHEIARQLNLPPSSRVAALQPEEQIVRVQERVVVPGSESRELSAEVARLRGELTASQERVRQQQEELDRIRRTLTSPRP